VSARSRESVNAPDLGGGSTPTRRGSKASASKAARLSTAEIHTAPTP
jgi:hypothetical protein